MATVTISNPDALNALTPEMQFQFIDAITALESDDQVRASSSGGRGKGLLRRGSMESLSEIQSPRRRRGHDIRGSKCGTPS